MLMNFLAAYLPNGVHPQILQFFDKIANPNRSFNVDFLKNNQHIVGQERREA